MYSIFKVNIYSQHKPLKEMSLRKYLPKNCFFHKKYLKLNTQYIAFKRNCEK